MDKKIIKTLVKSDHKLGSNKFVFGRVMGAIAVVCKDDPANGLEHGYGICDEGRIIKIETTDEQYGQFNKLIDSWYPGLCVFNYVD